MHQPRDALEGKGPQRRPQRRLDRRLEEVAKAVGGGYCRLQIPVSLAFGVRGTVAGQRVGALVGGEYLLPLPMHPCTSPLSRERENGKQRRGSCRRRPPRFGSLVEVGLLFSISPLACALPWGFQPVTSPGASRGMGLQHHEACIHEGLPRGPPPQSVPTYFGVHPWT